MRWRRRQPVCGLAERIGGGGRARVGVWYVGLVAQHTGGEDGLLVRVEGDLAVFLWDGWRREGGRVSVSIVIDRRERGCGDV